MKRISNQLVMLILSMIIISCSSDKSEDGPINSVSDPLTEEMKNYCMKLGLDPSVFVNGIYKNNYLNGDIIALVALDENRYMHLAVGDLGTNKLLGTYTDNEPIPLQKYFDAGYGETISREFRSIVVMSAKGSSGYAAFVNVNYDNKASNFLIFNGHKVNNPEVDNEFNRAGFRFWIDGTYLFYKRDYQERQILMCLDSTGKAIYVYEGSVFKNSVYDINSLCPVNVEKGIQYDYNASYELELSEYDYSKGTKIWDVSVPAPFEIPSVARPKTDISFGEVANDTVDYEVSMLYYDGTSAGYIVSINVITGEWEYKY